MAAFIVALTACSSSVTQPTLSGYAPTPSGALSSSTSSLAIGGGTTSATFTVSEPGSTAPLSASIACKPRNDIASITPATATPSSTQGTVAFTVSATGAPGTCAVSVSNGSGTPLSIAVTLSARSTLTVSTRSIVAAAGDAPTIVTASEPGYAGTFYASSDCAAGSAVLAPSTAIPSAPGGAVTFRLTPNRPASCTVIIRDANGSSAPIPVVIAPPPLRSFPNGNFASPAAITNGEIDRIDGWTLNVIRAYNGNGSNNPSGFLQMPYAGSPTVPAGSQALFQFGTILGGTGGTATLATHVVANPSASYVISFLAAAQEPGDSIKVTYSASQPPVVIPITTTGFATYATPPVVPGSSFDALTFEFDGMTNGLGLYGTLGSTAVMTDVAYQLHL